MDWFSRGDYSVTAPDFGLFAVALLLAFLGGHVIAWTYMYTHTGISYSRSYVNTLVLMPVIVALVMLVLANNLVLAFGLMAIFAMVRFRSILRDTLDTSYILAVIVFGLACGTLKFATAIMGCTAIVAIMFYFWLTSFGSRHRYDLVLTLQWNRSVADLHILREVLQLYSRQVRVASQRSLQARDGFDISYRLLLRDPGRWEEVVESVRAIEGVGRVSGLQAEEESEV